MSITLIQPTAVDTPYPQHARNCMAQEPKLPSPMIDPHQVAQAILDAAVNGGRDVKVGAMAVLNTTTAKLLPALGDRMSAMQADRQQQDIAPQAPGGTLFHHGVTGRVRPRLLGEQLQMPVAGIGRRRVAQWHAFARTGQHVHAIDHRVQHPRHRRLAR